MCLNGRTLEDLFEICLPTQENVDQLYSGHKYMVLLPAVSKQKRKGTYKIVAPERIKYLRFDRYATVPCKFVDTDFYPHIKYLMNEVTCYFKFKEQNGN